MTTLRGGEPPETPNDHDRSGPPSLQATITIVGAAIGAILAIAILSAFRNIGTVATVAITTIGSIVGAAIGVVALEARRRSK